MASSSANLAGFFALVGLNFMACGDGDRRAPPPVGGETGDPRPVVVIGTGATASGGDAASAGRTSGGGQGNGPGGASPSLGGASSGTFAGSGSSFSGSSFGGSSSTFAGSSSNGGSPVTGTAGVSSTVGGSF